MMQVMTLGEAGDQRRMEGQGASRGRQACTTPEVSRPFHHHDRARIDEDIVEDAFHAPGSNGIFPMQLQLKMLTSAIAEKNSKEEIAQDAALAQLIADSTEKKFKLNSLFKGMWKKKHYSFDLS